MNGPSRVAEADEPGYASYSIRYVEDLRAKAEWWKSAHDTCCDGGQKLVEEVERLQRENGALARTYALAEAKLRERTEALRQHHPLTAEWLLCPICNGFTCQS